MPRRAGRKARQHTGPLAVLYAEVAVDVKATVEAVAEALGIGQGEAVELLVRRSCPASRSQEGTRLSSEDQGITSARNVALPLWVEEQRTQDQLPLGA
jgi:hypothetical protein